QHGRVRMIDAAAGVADGWRPVSLVPSRTVDALAALGVPVATLLLAARLTAADRVRVLHVLLLLAGASAFVGLLQASGLQISLFRVNGFEISGLFANKNHQAALLAAMLPMLAVAARVTRLDRRSAWLVKLLAAGAALVVVVLIIVTGSRAGLVLGVGAILLALFYGLLRIELFERMPAWSAVATRLALGAVVAGSAALATVLAARGLAFSRLETAGADIRPLWWASIVHVLPGYLPWGSGIGSYDEVYRIIEPTALLRETYSNHAHNEYLEVALTAGIPGLLLTAAALLWAGREFWRNRRGAEPEPVFARLGVSIILILAVASITDYPLRTPLLSAVLALAASWCAAPLPDRDATRSGDRQNARPAPTPRA
uniref:O-antigen ligase family protein n=1 Tax=Sphingomonas bacterium TaxID=1895847 RepID=UPI0015761843